MKLICPSCGAVHSAEGWQNDVIARQALNLMGEMPPVISSRCFAYLALFRPGEKSLTWKKVYRLLTEMKTLIVDPYIQWQKRVARPNNAKAWSIALDRIIEKPPKSLPLKSHGYLRSIAYEIADEIDRKREIRHNQSERSGVCLRKFESENAGDLEIIDYQSWVQGKKGN